MNLLFTYCFKCVKLNHIIYVFMLYYVTIFSVYHINVSYTIGATLTLHLWSWNIFNHEKILIKPVIGLSRLFQNLALRDCAPARVHYRRAKGLGEMRLVIGRVKKMAEIDSKIKLNFYNKHSKTNPCKNLRKGKAYSCSFS